MNARLLIFLLFLFPLIATAQSEEFYGPQASWTNLKLVYHAAGDGITDDTKAIQAAMNDLCDGKHSPVLYIPKGTYKITATLTMKSVLGMAIIGEDPLTTIIKWDGAANAKMFLLNGVSYSEYGRLTWDGNNKAAVAVAHEWIGGNYANSGTAHYDEIFKNVGTGLKSGKNMDAEFSIRRCRFYNCTSAGISLQGWNALDWWVWDCYFDKCYTAVANNFPENGAGNFHVYRSIFKNSVYADISLGNSNYYSFRNNISYNSNAFIIARQFSNTSPITIQNNLIINNKSVVEANLFTKGNVLFLDNIFVSPDSDKNYIIQNLDSWDDSQSDITMVGNQYTATKKIVQTDNDRIIDIDSKYGIAAPITPSLNPKPFAPLIKYPVYEITNAMKADEIQTIINKAGAKNKKAVIHFKYGNYNITKSIQVPAGAPLIIFGDGLQSILKCTDTTIGSVMQVAYPARSVVRNIKILGSNKADGIVIYDNDKTGNSIYANQLMVFHGVQTNISINKFENTNFCFENIQHNYCAKGTSIKVTGTSKSNATIFKLFGGESAGNYNSYGVDKNGRILVYDTWYEDGGNAQFLSLKNSGEFVLNGGKIANTNAAKAAFITVDSFSGKFVLTEIIYNNPGKSIRFSNRAGTAQFLSLGNLSWNDSTSNMYNMDAPKSTYALINNRYSLGKGSFPIPNAGADYSVAFIKNMLSTIRTNSVLRNNDFPKNATHFTMDRLMIEQGVNNVRVERSN